MIPESIEQYYQEIGRAGRDGKGATAYMFYTNKNIQVRKTHFIDKSFPAEDEIKELFTKAVNNETGKKTLQYFAEEELQSALSYFLNCGALSIEGKGFTNLNVFKSNKDTQLQNVIESSRTGMVIAVMMKQQYVNLNCRDFFNITYSALVSDSAILSKNLDKCLVIEAKESELSVDQIEEIETDTVVKRAYKHSLLDYLVYLLDNYDNSKSLHQEIGRYLGVNKHLLGKIHKTESGIWVRSKSEVIIANILYRSQIPFDYEDKLFYEANKWKEPDFTIKYNGKIWYWEHLGMTDDEKYNDDWKEKKEIYEKMGIMKQLITTKESSILSRIVNDKIKFIIEN